VTWTEHCRADVRSVVAVVEFIAERLVHIDDCGFGGAIVGWIVWWCKVRTRNSVRVVRTHLSAAHKTHD